MTAILKPPIFFYIMSRTKAQAITLAIALLLLGVLNAAPDNTYLYSAPPTLIAPADGATVTLPAQLQWTGTSGNANVEIYECSGATGVPDDINLSGFRKTLGPKAISSIPNDLSGITFNPLTNTLFMITNKNSKIYETNLSGNIIRTINLTGYDDTEDIAHLYGTKYAIAEEKKGRVLFIDITASTSSINLSNATYTQLSGTWNSGDGVEGVSYNPATNMMYGVVEVPMKLHRFPRSSSSSFPSSTTVGSCNLQLNPFGIGDVAAIHHLGLTSGLSNLNVADHMLILSDESHALIEIDENCNEHGRLNLPSNGLSGLTQLEGVTMDNNGTIYVVGEPNEFYVYSNPNLNLNPSNNGTLIHNATVSGTTYTVPTGVLQAGKEYCWRVGKNGEWSNTRSFTPKTPPQTGDVVTKSKISRSSDDVEEASNGSMYLNSTDLELTQDNSTQTIGMIFRNLNIPQGANILSAKIQFAVDETSSGSTNVTIQGELNSSANNFSSANFNVSSRPKTSQSVQWQILAWNTAGQRSSSQQTPDLKLVIQQIVSRNSFNSNSNVGIIITGTGKRTAESYDGSSSLAPELTVTYNTESCPAVGTPCNDNDANTNNDKEDGNCNCVGTPIACNPQGTPCNDGDPTTENDIENGNCVCTGTPCPTAGTTCDDNDDTTKNDRENGQCECIGTPCPAVGTPCDDGNPNTSGDQEDGFCNCNGSIASQFVESRIATGDDDVEENGRNGNMYMNNSDLELVYDRSYTGNQVIGLRFTNLYLPPDAEILNAYVQFTVDETRNTTPNLTIYGEDTGNSAPFANMKYDVSNRRSTQAQVAWIPPTWNVAGAAGPNERTVNIAPIIQEIVDRNDWDGLGRAITIVIKGTGRRVAEAYNGSPSGAPMLHIDYDYDGQNFAYNDNENPETDENHQSEVEQRTNESVIRQIDVYPNPAAYEINVEIDIDQTTIEKGTMTILDISGKILSQTPFNPQIDKSVELDVEMLSQGTYIVHIQVGTYTATKKFIKK